MEEFRHFRNLFLESFNLQSDSFEAVLQSRFAGLDALKQRASRTQELETENADLRSQVEALNKKLKDVPVQSPIDIFQRHEPNVAMSRTPTGRSSREHDLKDLLEQKTRDYAKLAKAHNLVLERCRSFQSALRQYRTHSQAPTGGHPRRKGEPGHDSRPTVMSHQTPAKIDSPPVSFLSRAVLSHSDELPSASPHKVKVLSDERIGSSGAVSDVICALEEIDSPALEKRNSENDHEALLGSTDSESLRNQHPEPATTDHQADSLLSSDGPVFVSERCLKRKRRRAGPVAANHRLVDTNVIKGEVSSSPPLHFAELQAVFHDTLDLDDISLPLMSPQINDSLLPQPDSKKRRKVDRLPASKREREWELGHGSIAHQPTKSMSKDQARQKKAQRREKIETPGSHYALSCSSSIMAPNDETSFPNASSTKSRSSNKISRNHAVLQPKTSNPKVGLFAANGAARDNRCSKVGEMAEDAENYASNSQVITPDDRDSSTSGPRPLSADGGKLDNLLHTTGTVYSVLQSAGQKSEINPRFLEHVVSTTEENALRTPPTKSLGSARSFSNSEQKIDGGMKAQARDRHSPKIPVSGAKPIGRLRDRELRVLRLDDFKINTAFNSDRDYAFSEVVRKRSERKCLPNCKKPECCGNKFIKAVQIGGYMPAPRLNVFQSSHHFQGRREAPHADDERRILEAYLGNGAGRLDFMPEVEKRDLLNKAYAYEFANSHGRHRQAHERPASPPGFWRTDMPSTQEAEADRLRAQDMETRKVEERWREALRPGGKWMFKDE